MNNIMYRSAWIEIDRHKLISNIKAVQQRVGGSKIIGVVKANAYGHGAIEVSKTYLECGVDMLGVATLDEAKGLRDAGITCRIIMMSLIPDELAFVAVELNVIPLVSTFSFAQALSSAAKSSESRTEILVVVDTGMGRIGFLPENTSVSEILEISKLTNISIYGIMTHFSSADLESLEFTHIQNQRFMDFYNMLIKAGVKVKIRTAANSPSILRLPETFYEAVRPGTIIWGCYPACVHDHTTVPVKPIMSIKCKVIYLKIVPEGTPISYGQKYVTNRESTIATLPMGYADGYTRTLLGKGRVLIHGLYAPVLGTICMDQIMVDVTDIPDVKIGDEAVILGSQADKDITIEELETKTGLCSGELFHGFSQRLPIVYV